MWEAPGKTEIRTKWATAPRPENGHALLLEHRVSAGLRPRLCSEECGIGDRPHTLQR